MKYLRFSPALFVGILIALFFGISLIIRIALPWDAVFTNDWIKFTSIDAYYQMRIVDNMVFNFPGVTEFDPYLIYHSEGGYGNIHFFNWFLAGIIWIIGLGNPTPQTVDVVGVIFPTILAALTIIPVYFIGKTLFNRWVGVFAAGLVAILPGEFLGRSFLGFTDTHIMETLLTTTFLAFFIVALKTAVERQLTFGHLRRFDRKVIMKPLVLSIFAGIFLGFYMITWIGGMLFVFIITVYLFVQFIISHLKKKATDHLVICSFILFLVALIMFVPFSHLRELTIAMVFITILPIVLSSISYFMNSKNLKLIYYPIGIVVLAALFYGAMQLIAPELINSAVNDFKMVFVPGGPMAATTDEMQPFISLEKSFPTAIAWGTYTTDFFFISPVLLFHESPWIASLKWFPGFAFVPILLAIWLFRNRKSVVMSNTLVAVIIWGVLLALTIWLWFIAPAEWKLWFPGFGIIAFFILVQRYIKQRGEEQAILLFFTWTIIIFVATLVQRRFNYYLVINVALLAAYFSYLIIWWAGLRKLVGNAREGGPEKQDSAGTKKIKKRKETSALPIYHINIIVAIFAVFTITFSFNIVEAKEAAWANDPNPAHGPQFMPTDAWQESLLWLKDNTPEPFSDPDAYYRRFEMPAQAQDIYTEESYAVTSWWDFGYWITRTGHRIPSANPSQAPIPIKEVASLLLETDMSKTREKIEDLNTSYIIIDQPMATGKYFAIATWAAKEEEFFGIYYIQNEGRLMRLFFYYPEYYQTALVRLYNFDGKSVTDIEPLVILYDDVTDNKTGERYKILRDIKKFSSYQEALIYSQSLDTPNNRIVSGNRFVSPLPLDSVENFRLINSSSQLKPSSELKITMEQQAESIRINLNEEIVTTPEVKIFEYIE